MYRCSLHLRRPTAPISVVLLLLAVFAFAVSPVLSEGHGSPAWGRLEAGPFGVGFQVFESYDPSRPFLPREAAQDGAVRARPLQVGVWYPAATDTSEDPLTFGDYVELIGRETDFAAPAEAARRPSRETLRALMVPDFVSELDEAALVRLLSVSTAAVLEAPPAAGRFPLLLWGKGENGHAVDHALLGEYLASSGYVVASTPALPAHARRIPRHDALSVRAQLRDLEFVLQALAEEPFVDLERLGLLAWSFGGLPAALLRMRHPDVAALVSFDSRIGFRNDPGLFIEAADYDPSRMSVPVLHVTGSNEPRVEGLKDSSFLDALAYADVYRVTLEGVRHRDFNFLWGALPQLADLEGSWPVPPEEVLTRLARATRSFFDAAFTGETRPAPDAFGLSGVAFQPGRPAPPTRGDFLWTLETSGVTAAAELFRTARRTEPELELFKANELLRHARDLLRAGEVDEAAAAVRLELEAHQSSTMGHYMLGQMAASQNHPEMAREHYARCLEVLAGDASLPAERKELLRRDVERRLAVNAVDRP